MAVPFRYVLAAAKRIPPGVWRPGVSLAAHLVALHPPRPVRQWQLNAEIVTGQAPTRRETARAMASWARNLFESAQLQNWSIDDIMASLVISDEDRARLMTLNAQRVDGAGGVVIALPHMGSWDMAGAWACPSGLLVSTVAEEIEEFDFFVAVREALGMKVYGHRDRGAVAKLVDDQRNGRVVCLVTDRNFGRGGVPVQWGTSTGTVEVKMPVGAAHVALRSGATLVGAACHYEGRRMRLVISQPIVPPPDEAEPLAWMNQQLADFFSAQVRSNVIDWHLLSPFFPDHVAS